jgi:ribosomal protein L11 methylase PrmA
LPKSGLLSMLKGMRNWIASLRATAGGIAPWRDYEKRNSYAAAETAQKREFVERFVRSTKPGTLWDLGCNSGSYSELALKSGADRVIGFDSDNGALAAAVSRADENRLNFLPLSADICNPSPAQGWRQTERRGLLDRANGEALLALALLHHIVIGRNIPLHQAVSLLVNLAPAGVIEFVPPQDPMVTRLFRGRSPDMFDDYTVSSFKAALCKLATIEAERTVTAGRVLFAYRRPARVA